MATSKYVIHCEECKRVIESSLREGPCPPEKEVKEMDFSGYKDAQAYTRRRFPYWDDGLGMTITSNRHKSEELKARGLVQVDGNPKPKTGRIFFT